MPYSETTHFSDKNSYKILCVSSYGLKDMNLAKYEHFLKFWINRKLRGFSHQQRVSHSS
jgi:hypothetical protein